MRSSSSLLCHALVLTAALVAFGCASDKAATGSGSAPSGAEQEIIDVPGTTSMEKMEREELETVFHNLFDVPKDARIPPQLLMPKTVKDAQDVVRSDNIALFTQAEKVFTAYLEEHPDDIQNRTWHAQLFLVWADSAAMTKQSLRREIDKLREREGELAAAADPEADEQDPALAEVSWLISLGELAIDNLEQLRADKLAVGAEKSQALLQDHGDTYEGHRLAADLYRMQEAWDDHEEAMRKLEKLNPDSNGLRFLRGVVALQREKELKQAERYFKEAVKNDRQFAKAQYYLALTYFKMRRMDDARRALDKTLEMSPGHPFANALRGYISRAREL